MLSKWHWRFATETNRWWRELINTKYPNPHSCWHTGKIDGGYANSAWANIMKERSSFWNLACIDPGSGAWTSFWHDRWIPEASLSETFPRIAAVTSNPDATVSGSRVHSGSEYNWVIPLNFSLRGGLSGSGLSCLTFLRLTPFQGCPMVLADLSGFLARIIPFPCVPCTGH
ncbi:unnamed protein product [Linum tenue]|uniref:Uncharacterized protein n=1 Tax=Linum tenue TaxID=586396 RepID=A0AAV0GYQ8_9ROSI|nr:unnamed protein product [Linum tenue]